MKIERNDNPSTVEHRATIQIARVALTASAVLSVHSKPVVFAVILLGLVHSQEDKDQWVEKGVKDQWVEKEAKDQWVEKEVKE